MLSKMVLKVLIIVQVVNVVVAGTVVYVHTGGLGTNPLGMKGTYAAYSDIENADGNRLTGATWITVDGCPKAYTLPLRPQGATSVSDPGFPFRDANCDGVYTAGTDTAIPVADVQDGLYDAGTHCLVIPPSVGPISAGSIVLAGNKVTILVNMTSNNGITVTASSGVIVRDVVWSGSSAVTVTTSTGAMTVTNALIETVAGNINIDQTLAPGSSNITGTYLHPTGNIRVLTKGDLTAIGAVLRPSGNIQYTAEGALFSQDAVLDAATGNVQMTAGRGADLDNVILRSGTGNFIPTLKGPFDMRNGCLRVSGNLNVKTTAVAGADPPRMRIDGCTGSSQSGQVTFDAAAGPLNMSAVDMRGVKTVFIAPGDIDARFGVFNATTEISFNLGSAIRTFYTEGAYYDDNDDLALIKPSGVAIVGTPARGGTTY